jgi:hypothetical protein
MAAKSGRFAQGIINGHSDVCGPPRPPQYHKKQRNLVVDSSPMPVSESNAMIPASSSDIALSSVAYDNELGALYTMETLAVTVTGTGVGALLLGFLLGYVLGRKAIACGKDVDCSGGQNRGEGGCVSAEYEFLEQRPPMMTPHRFVTHCPYASSPDSKSLLTSRQVCSGTGLQSVPIERTYYSQRPTAVLDDGAGCGHYATPTLPYVDLVASSSGDPLSSGCSPYSSSAVVMAGHMGTASRRPRNLTAEVDDEGRSSLRKMYL